MQCLSPYGRQHNAEMELPYRRGKTRDERGASQTVLSDDQIKADKMH
jgi:hypothetical protein